MCSVFMYIVPYTMSSRYNQHECNITRAEYPTYLPTVNMSGWEGCRCGGRCRSFAPYINLYASIRPNKIIREKYYIDRFSEHTFFNERCIDGDDAHQMEINLKEAMSTAETYLNETSVICYYDENNLDYIYLHKDINYLVGILFTGLWVLIFVGWIIMNCVICKMEKKEKKRISLRHYTYELQDNI